MCPLYVYRNPKTGEEFDVLRPAKDWKKSHVLEDGTVCERVVAPFCGWKGNREVFEVDPGYVKKCNPKFIKFKDGHRERYDPTKHC